MPIFEYRGLDAQGQAVRGTMIGADLMQAASELTGKGFRVDHLQLAPNPVEMSAPAAPPTEEWRDITGARSVVMTDVVGPLIGQVSLSKLLFFFTQLSTMLKAGVGIAQSLDTLSNQTHDYKLGAVVREMRQHVLEGRPLTAGMQRYPEVFSPLMVSLIRAGEDGGILDDSLQQVADYIKNEIELRQLVRRVTIYPQILVALSIVIIFGANVIIGMLGRGNKIYSPLTEPATWVVLAPLLAFGFLFFRLGLQNPRFRHNYDAVMLYVPGIGKVLHQLAMAKFGRAFGALYKGGVAIPKAVQLAADACGSQFLRAKIYDAAQGLQEGAGITDTFARTGAFSPIVLDMVRTGEVTGNMDQMLERMADFYEGEAKTKSVQMAYILGAVILLLVAIYIGYIVITFWTGYFSGIGNALNQS